MPNLRSICKMSPILIIFIYTQMSWKMSLCEMSLLVKMSQFQESSNYCWWIFSFLEARSPYTYTLCWAGAHWAMPMSLCILSFSAGKPWLCGTATGWLGQGCTHTGQCLWHCASLPSLSAAGELSAFLGLKWYFGNWVQKATSLNKCIWNGTS